MISFSYDPVVLYYAINRSTKFVHVFEQKVGLQYHRL